MLKLKNIFFFVTFFLFACESGITSPVAGDTDTGTGSDMVEQPDGNQDLTWVTIDGGTFEMGGELDDEIPLHNVTVTGFEMLKSEVTVAQFWKCYSQSICETRTTGGDCNFGKPDRGNFPVTCVDWHQASAFCQWVGGSLPSEAQWEYVASNGADEDEHPWGDAESNCVLAVMKDTDDRFGCGTDLTWEVCKKPAGNTKHDICDMVGNVWEWMEDDHHGSYEGAPVDGSAWVNDPRSSYRMNRGGSYGSPALYVRSSFRHHRNITYYGVGVGFRCVR